MSNITNVKVGIKGRAMPSGGEAGQILQKASDKDFDTIWTTPAGGASGNIPQPSVSLPDPDVDGGAIGTGIAFARQDHQHKLNVSDTLTDVKMDGTRSLGSAGTYARTDHVHPHDTSKADLTIQLSDITIAVSDWTEVSADAHYTYDVTALVTGGTSKSRIDLYPDYTAILQMDNDGTLGVYIENTSGTFTAHAVGSKPTASLTFQAERTELA